MTVLRRLPPHRPNPEPFMTDKNGVELDKTPVKPGPHTYADPSPSAENGGYDAEWDEERKRAREADTANRRYYSGA